LCVEKEQTAAGPFVRGENSPKRSRKNWPPQRSKKDTEGASEINGKNAREKRETGVKKRASQWQEITREFLREKVTKR